MRNLPKQLGSQKVFYKGLTDQTRSLIVSLTLFIIRPVVDINMAYA